MAILVYTDPSGQEMSVPLGPDSPLVTIGRATDCTIRSNRKSVSRRHAEFHYNNGNYQVVDLNSSNGTYLIVNDERKPVVKPEPLSHTDEVWCGDFILRFYEDDASTSVGPQDFHAQVDYGQHQQDGYGPQRATHDFGDPVQPGVSGVGFNQRPRSASFGHPIGAGSVPEGYDPSFGATPTPGPVGVGFGDDSFASQQDVFGPPQDYSEGAPSEDLQRIKDEKKAIEELAARQAQELDELRARLESGGAVAPGEGPDLERLSMELEASRREKDRLVDELRMTQETSLDVEMERERAMEAERRLEEATAKIDDLRQAMDREIQAKDRDIEVLEQELERVQAELRDAGGGGPSDEVESLRRAAENQEKLIGELNQKIQSLQEDLTHETDAAKSLQTLVSEYEARLDELEPLAEAATNAAALQEELEVVSSENADMKSEIEGLKQRLKLEKKRARDAGADQIEALQARVAELEANGGEGGGADAAVLKTLADHARTLDRLVDAIERTDLGGLSTVDRVRLQSAIRDARPRETLSAMLELMGEG